MDTQSDNVDLLFAALSVAQGQIDDASKGAENPYFKSKYADLSAIRSVIRGPMAQNGLGVIQLPRTVDGGAIVKTIITHSSGQFISNELFMPAAKNDPHGLGSAITYARRYSIMSMLALAAEDDDGNAAVESVKKQNNSISDAIALGSNAAKQGSDQLSNWWKGLPEGVRKSIPTDVLANMKKVAKDNDPKVQ
jgi:hypothetical protein